jgi:hypothetical protein
VFSLYKQALFKLGTSREERLRRVTLQVDEDDVNFALQVWILNSAENIVLSTCGIIG